METEIVGCFAKTAIKSESDIVYPMPHAAHQTKLSNDPT